MLSRHVCWSRGKRWRLIGQETIKDTRMLGESQCYVFYSKKILGGPFFLLEVLSEMKGRPLQSPTCKARPLKEKP